MRLKPNGWQRIGIVVSMMHTAKYKPWRLITYIALFGSIES